MTQTKYLILVAICCLPLFLINMKDSHDWGDDFAQYLIQAENVVKGNPQAESRYVYNSSFPVVAPPAYPVGFPLLLSGVYAFYGHSIIHYNFLITAVLFLYCLALALFFRKYFSWLTGFFMVLLFAYNPWTLSFKTEILSDLPFSLLLLLSLLFYQMREKTFYLVLASAAMALLFSIRGAGFVFLVAVSLHNGYLFFKSKSLPEKKGILRNSFLLIGISTGIYFLLNHVLFKIPSVEFLGFYQKAWMKSSSFDSIIQNLNYYVDVFKAFYHPQVKEWTFSTSIAESFAIGFMLIGLLYSMFRQRSFLDLLVWLYILLILLYPYTNSGFRFILPVIPFLMVYIVLGMKQMGFDSNLSRNWVIIAIGTAVLLLYKPSVEKFIEEKKSVIVGPQEAASKEAFQYINSHLGKDDLVVFKKPKVLALYCNVKTTSVLATQTNAEISEMCEKMGVSYLLKNADIEDSSLDEFIRENQTAVRGVWRNDKFVLYKYSG